MELKDRVIVVTGGGSGIGEGFARRAVADGATHVITLVGPAGRMRKLMGSLGRPL